MISMKQKQIQIKKSYKDVMSDLMESFKGGNLPEAVARTYIQFQGTSSFPTCRARNTPS